VSALGGTVDRTYLRTGFRWRKKMSGPDPKEPSDLLSNGGSNTTQNKDGTIHEVIYDSDRQQHISWDRNKDGDYVDKGHTTNDKTKEVKSWDP
jgi:hypothetical protein